MSKRYKNKQNYKSVFTWHFWLLSTATIFIMVVVFLNSSLENDNNFIASLLAGLLVYMQPYLLYQRIGILNIEDMLLYYKRNKE